jgi:phosphoribosylaminoimidazole-succinocarboxamide synthase
MLAADHLLRALPHALTETRLPLPGRATGKVREWYTLADRQRLIVTTDRLSAFDRILGAVPYKGQVLNQLSAWWFEQTNSLIPNSLISVPDPNASIMRTVTPLPVEVVVRGYITGVTGTALWQRYSLGERDIYGHRFPDGLRKNQALPQPIITPTTKGGPTGHDERLTCAEVVSKELLDAATWERVMDSALAIFARGQALASRAGLILVDTKYEFGRSAEGEVMLIDEVHTPDSSRFWKADSYAERFGAGEEPENFDKEFVRLEYAARGYRGEGVPPPMPEGLWVTASQRYIAIYELLTGNVFQPGEYPVETRLCANLRRAGVIADC